ncbi:Eco47II family restriction endonuclease [Reichenbachiella versicolor]|uniref:Eco47II family restriction endonuclease n=1 Tax=Reichenbachiella versicolor TaxID=1821036 RepID=UPI000D6E35A1|nr:Eco47II family restriction endonuclease [Reichenbachiella versicolor]
MPKLEWISDVDLEKAVSFLLQKATEAKEKTDKNFGKNVIDPFSAIFEIAGFQIDYDTWVTSEKNRQSQKTLQNHIGEFHQNVLGSVSNWENMKTGNVIDLVSNKHKIIAEIKNKYNTISGGKLADLYYSLDGLVMPKNSIYKDYTSYYVAVIPKKKERYNKVFTPSDKSKGAKCPPNEKVREIDGASFYDLVTGKENALDEMYSALPEIIEKCTNGKCKIQDTDKLKVFFNSAFENII